MKWERYGVRPGVRYELTGTGWWVIHCGHPTALWPYYVESPAGEMILAPSGRGFQFLKDAKATAERLAAHRSPS